MRRLPDFFRGPTARNALNFLGTYLVAEINDSIEALKGIKATELADPEDILNDVLTAIDIEEALDGTPESTSDTPPVDFNKLVERTTYEATFAADSHKQVVEEAQSEIEAMTELLGYVHKRDLPAIIAFLREELASAHSESTIDEHAKLLERGGKTHVSRKALNADTAFVKFLIELFEDCIPR